MIKSNEIITLKVDDNWFKNGLNYALMSWTSTFNRMGKPNPYSRIEKIVLGIIAEIALESYLQSLKINFETKGKTKWYEEDRYDIGINGYAIDVKSNFLDTKSQYISSKIENLREDKFNWFLKCHALVPLDQFNPGTNERRAHKRDKVYMFPFIEGFFNEHNYSKTLVHAFWDYKWLKRAEYKELPKLGNILLKYSGTKKNASLRVFGTTGKNKACIEEISLSENQVQTTNNFHQVFSIEWTGTELPDGTLRIISHILNLEEIIKPKCSFELQKTDNGYWPIENNWQSLKLYNSEVHLLGWVFEDDYRVIGNELKRFTKTIEQYSEIKVDNWGCLVKELEPMKTINKI
jgi:hypothetical protein